jgi:hypothetical protein
MGDVAFVGPSYSLRSRAADVQRTIGMAPRPIEPGNTKTGFVLKDIWGLVQFSNLGGALRGAENVNGRIFAVAGASLYEVASDGTKTLRGTLLSASGFVGMAFNTTQLAIADDLRLYVLTLGTNVFQVVAGFPGSGRISYLNQYILYVLRSTQQFGWTNLADATSLDSLNFASAESSPDDLVGLIVDHRELLLGGTDSFENWVNTGTNSIFERNQGVAIEEGLASQWTLQKLAGTVFWLSASSRGQGAVYKLQGQQPVKVSTEPIEERLQGIDLTGSSAYVREMDKSSFYCLNVPALNTTLVYDATLPPEIGWHEEAELVNGLYTKYRARVHVYGYQKHLVGGDDGWLYRMDPAVHNNAGDPLVRDRISPENATRSRERLHFNHFTLDCDRGTGGQVMLRWSNDGSANFGPWKTRSLGAVGVFDKTVKWDRPGSAKDRVWQARCTDDVPWNPVSATVE